MQLFVEFSPWLVAMAVLVVASGFFSCSEAALFYLRRQDRRAFRSGTAAQRIAARLLDDPDRLLSAVLFWNLVINVVFFALSSIVSIQLERQERTTEAGAFAVGSLLVLIFCGEMLPKSLAVVRTRILAALVAPPLAVAVRALDPILPVMRMANLLSRRLLAPRFQAEPYLELGDLERAIQVSTSDSALLKQEVTVLHNIVSLSDIRVEELMRPRTQFLAFAPPVALSDLEGKITPSGFVLVNEPGGDDIASAVPLQYLFEIPGEHLEHVAEQVSYVPWCATAAVALEEMRRLDRKVVAVVNEYGETIGIVTFDDVLATIFTESPSRSQRLLSTSSLREVGDGAWRVTGITSLRRIGRHFGIELPTTRAVTVAGVLQEILQRMPTVGDGCDWGPFRWDVIDAPEGEPATVELRPRADQEELEEER